VSRAREVLLGTLVSLAMLSAAAAAEDGTAPASERASCGSSTSHDERSQDGGARTNVLEPLVPEIAANPYRLEAGVRPFLNRLSFSPGLGTLGKGRLFTLRVAYSPNPWLGYEASIGHNPGQATHAALHMVSAMVRHPLPGRLQPYATAGYGMMIVFPGPSLNTDPVTKNAVAVGGGLELYVRSDLALRAEMKRATVFGRQKDRDGVVAYDYVHQTIGFAFYRTVQP